MPKVFNRATQVGGEYLKIGTYYVNVIDFDADGNVTRATGANVPADSDKGFAKGCRFVKTDGSVGTTLYTNEGSASSADFNALVTPTVEVLLASLIGSEARTATADGLTTGAITTPTSFRTFITVTSGNAAHAITLPAISASTIGQEIYLTVGSNGYELLTPASSNNTINQVDSDGTNQLDVAADTTVRCTQITATGWLAETIAAATIAITAPDND
jgi:hypothetical protein